MKKILAVFIPVILIGLIAQAEVKPDDWKRLKNGEVILSEVSHKVPDGSMRKDYLARIYVKADRQAIWKILCDYETVSEFLPNVASAKVIKKEGNKVWAQYVNNIDNVKIRYNLIIDVSNLYKRIEWKLNRSAQNDVKEYIGYWVLEDAPDGSGTVLGYFSYVESGINAPDIIVRAIEKRKEAEIVKNTKLRVESGGKWKKPQGS